jgi:hypothetical protein
MKSQNKVTKLLFSVMLVLLTIIVLAPPAKAPPAPNGSTTLEFSVNPATLSGDSTPDVTITTTTTSSVGQPYIDEGKVQIFLATDVAGNPVPAASVVTWVNLTGDGQNPVNGITTLDVDLEALGFVCGTVGGFRAKYVTSGGSTKVDTHFSDGVDLEAVCGECEWVGETAWSDGPGYIEANQWATYTPYVPNSTVTLYAGQTLNAGTVHFSDVDGNGDITITITLNSGWRFLDDPEKPETVKIQDYAAPPSGNPSPGQFAWKFEAESSPFTTTAITGNYYYGVHVDVEREVCE